MAISAVSRCKRSYDGPLEQVAKESKISFLESLPEELQMYVLSFLRKNDLARAASTCKSLQMVVISVMMLENKKDYRMWEKRLQFLIERLPQTIRQTLSFNQKVFFGPFNQNPQTRAVEKSIEEKTYELHGQHENLKGNIKVVLKATMPFLADKVSSLAEDILECTSSDETYTTIFNALMEPLYRGFNEEEQRLSEFYDSEDGIDIIYQIACHTQDPAQKSNELIVAFNLIDDENVINYQEIVDEAFVAAKDIKDYKIKSEELKTIYEAYLSLNNLEGAFDAINSMPNNNIKLQSLCRLFKCSVSVNNLDLAVNIAREMSNAVKRFFALAKICELKMPINVQESIALANEALTIGAEESFSVKVQSLIPRKKNIELKIAATRSTLQAIIAVQ